MTVATWHASVTHNNYSVLRIEAELSVVVTALGSALAQVATDLHPHDQVITELRPL